MSKARLILSLTGIVGLLILAGGVGIWAFPLRAPAQAAAASQPAEKEIPPRVITAIQPIRQVWPVYPPEAKAAGIQGSDKLRVTINKDGRVMDIQALSGPPQLMKAAIEAVTRWRYAPSKEIRVATVTIVFALRREGAAAAGSQPAEKEIPPYAFAAIHPVSQVPVVYPPIAKMAGIQGNVRLRVTINTDGSVMDIGVLSGPPVVVKAAMDAVSQFRYAPSKEVRVTIVTVVFALRRDGAAPSPRPAAEDLTPPMPIYKPDPAYTEEARAAKLQGTVVLQVTVAADGTVTDVKVTKPFDKGLDESAVQTVRIWKFMPAMKAGKPVAWTGSVEVTFKLL